MGGIGGSCHGEREGEDFSDANKMEEKGAERRKPSGISSSGDLNRSEGSSMGMTKRVSRNWAKLGLGCKMSANRVVTVVTVSRAAGLFGKKPRRGG